MFNHFVISTKYQEVKDIFLNSFKNYSEIEDIELFQVSQTSFVKIVFNSKISKNQFKKIYKKINPDICIKKFKESYYVKTKNFSYLQLPLKYYKKILENLWNVNIIGEIILNGNNYYFLDITWTKANIKNLVLKRLIDNQNRYELEKEALEMLAEQISQTSSISTILDKVITNSIILIDYLSNNWDLSKREAILMLGAFKKLFNDNKVIEDIIFSLDYMNYYLNCSTYMELSTTLLDDENLWLDEDYEIDTNNIWYKRLNEISNEKEAKKVLQERGWFCANSVALLFSDNKISKIRKEIFI